METSLLPTTPTALLSWLAQSTILLGAAWLFYYLGLRQERCFHYNRRYLVLAPWLALLAPVVLQLLAPWLPTWQAPLPVAELVYTQVLPTLTVQASAGPATPGWPINLPLVYGGVAGLLLTRLALRLLRLWLTTRRWPRQARAGYTLVLTGGRRPAGSFGRWVFWDETAPLTPDEARVVLAHEVAHVQQGHSRERLALEAARALLWACPFVYFFPRALATTHEFLADQAALRQPAAEPATAATYAALLARAALRQFHPALPLTHSFTQSLTLTRIRMLTSHSAVSRWKLWLTAPLSLALLGLLACEKAAELPPPPPPTVVNAQPAPPPPPALREDQPAPPPPPAVYTKVDQMPEYAGGMDQLIQDLGRAAKYPAAARAAKTQGTVFVGFIVAADGSMQAVELKKGIEYAAQVPDASTGQPASTKLVTPEAQLLNETALNAVRSLPGKWTPGRQDGKAVAVSYTVPVSFTLK